MSDSKDMGATTGRIHSAMAWVNRKVSAIAKERRNKEQGFNFRGIDDVYNVMHPLLAEAGIIFAPEKISGSEKTEERPTKGGGVRIFRLFDLQGRFIAEDGSELLVGPVQCEGADQADKGSGKATSQGIKHLFFATFTIPLEGAVEEGDAGEGEEGQPPEGAPPASAPPTPAPQPPASAPQRHDPKLEALTSEIGEALMIGRYLPPEVTLVRQFMGTKARSYRAQELIRDILKFAAPRGPAGRAAAVSSIVAATSADELAALQAHLAPKQEAAA